MASEFQRKKYQRLFRIYDTDDDGFITFDDYITYVDRLAERTGIASESSHMELIRAGFLARWDEICATADVNKDGRISRGEWVDAIIAHTSKGELPPSVKRTIELAFGLLDQNYDGKISPQEWAVHHELHGITEAPEQVFARLDADGAGYLTKQALSERIAEFYLSDDPAALGNQLFGALPD